jgi:transcriptional regulator with XRE-family HTH domain
VFKKIKPNKILKRKIKKKGRVIIMSSENIGSVIHALRKERKITQEALAAAVGVSAQAVSKWECGGLPDVYLIPAIADFFGVTTDKLFGRNVKSYENIETDLAEFIVSLDKEQIYKTWFNLFWIIQKAAGFRILPEKGEMLDKLAEDNDNPHLYSILNNKYRHGLSSMSLLKNQQYAFLMPKPEDYSELILPVEKYQELFAALSDIDCIKALLFLYRREHNDKKFTEKLLVDNLDISEEKAAEVIASLLKFEMISSDEIEIDESDITIYTFNARYSFIPFILFAKEMIQSPSHYMITIGLCSTMA